jgi:hypothetical protein
MYFREKQMSTHSNRLSLTITLTCITASALTTLATYYITTEDTPLLGGPTYTHHGWPLHWMTETHPAPTPNQDPTPSTTNYEPLNYLNNTLIYTTLYMTISITILYAKTRRMRQQAKKLIPTEEPTKEEKKAIEEKDEPADEKELMKTLDKTNAHHKH